MSKTENSRDFTKRLFGFSIGPIVNALIGFLSVPLTTWLLYPEELGKASMYQTGIMIVSSFIFLGLTNSYSREYHNFKDKPNLLLNSIFVPLIVSAVLIVTIVILKNSLSLIFFNEIQLLPIYIFAFEIPLRIFNRFSATVIRMKEKSKLFSFHQILLKVTNFSILLFVFLLIEKTYRAVIFASVGSTLIVTISQIFFMKTFWIDAFKGAIDKKLIKKLLKFGLPFVPAALLAWAFNSIDKVALRTFSSFQEIGIYSGAFKVIALLNIIKTSFSSFWSPTSYRWYDNNEPIHKYQRVSNSLMSLFITMSSMAILFKTQIFKLLSEKYLPSSDVFPFLMFIPILHTVSQTTSMGIQFKRKTHYQIYVFMFACIINIAGNLFMVPRYGAVGAAISTGLSYICYFYLRSYYSAKLWIPMKMGQHSLNILLLLTLATISSFNINLLIEIALVIIILVVNFKDLIYVSKNLKKALIKR